MLNLPTHLQCDKLAFDGHCRETVDSLLCSSIPCYWPICKKNICSRTELNFTLTLMCTGEMKIQSILTIQNEEEGKK